MTSQEKKANESDQKQENLGGLLNEIQKNVENFTTIIQAYQTLGSLEELAITLLFSEKTVQKLAKRDPELLQEICCETYAEYKTAQGTAYLKRQLGDTWMQENSQKE